MKNLLYYVTGSNIELTDYEDYIMPEQFEHSKDIRVCSNPRCGSSIDVKMAQELANKFGLAFAYCQESIYQILDCPNPECDGRFEFQSSSASPTLDMRGLILAPYSDVGANAIEQSLIIQLMDGWHKFLKFKYIKAWDDNNVSKNDFINCYKSKTLVAPHFENSSISLFQSREEIRISHRGEDDSKTISMLKLYPDTSKYRNLFLMLSPNKIRKIELDGAATYADGLSSFDMIERQDIWKSLIEEAAGKTFLEAVKGKLGQKGVPLPLDDSISTIIDRKLYYQQSVSREQLWEIVTKFGYEYKLDNFFRGLFKSILYPICTELSFENKRKELIEWVDKVEEGKALFVDAPMGIGKTHSIVEVLSSNKALSAVIFMPSIKLCEEIIEKLKGKIAARLNMDYWHILHQREEIFDENGSHVLDDEGFYQSKFKSDFLEHEAYYLDGINKKECIHFDEIKNKYRQNWIRKRNVCADCEKKGNCRFLLHDDKAQKARIVVTTHQQYERFYKNTKLHNWLKDGNEKSRDMFIVDEDIVLSKCYQPPYLDKAEIEGFLSVIKDFVGFFEDSEAINEKLINLYGLIGTCRKTSFIRPIDPDFQFPDKIKAEWDEEIAKIYEEMPRNDNESYQVGNHLELIEDALRYGFVVQKYSRRHRVYFNNSLSFDLSKVPPHVFFDGTMLKEEFLKKKLTGVQLVPHRIDINPLWNVRVFQNINSDITKKALSKERPKVKRFLSDLFLELGPNKRYLILSTKKTRTSYIKEHLFSQFPTYYYRIGHFGNLRGINDAKGCNVCIMIGSYLLSDAVEIAMALEFIQDKLPESKDTVNRNYFWKFTGSQGCRKYNPGYEKIEEIAKAVRHSEHRQALARTRYLFHDTDFYIISKDLVSEYDKFLPNVETTKFRDDLFPPRKMRSDIKFEQVKEAAIEIINKDKFVKIIDIFRKTKISRTTIRHHLKKLVSEGVLEKNKTKYIMSRQKRTL